MYKLKGAVICLAFLSILLVQLHCSKKKIKLIRISGSTTIQPFMKEVVEKYRKRRNIDIRLTAQGSKNGIDNLLLGLSDIAMSSTQILPNQLSIAKKRGIELKSFLLGYDIIIPIVHPQNPLADISLDKLKEIFSGKIKSWSELGGTDTVIEIFSRDSSSGSFHVWNKIVTPSDIGETNVIMRSSNSSVLANISIGSNTIGYVSSVYLNPEVKPLSVNGVKITDKDTIFMKHPIKRPLYLYVNNKSFVDEIKLFVLYILMNKNAKEIFWETGFFSQDTENE